MGPGSKGRLARVPGTVTAFVVLLAAGIAIRVWAMVAYPPAVLSGDVHDGAGYILGAHVGLAANSEEPSGYPVFLRVVHAVSRELAFTISVQHALGLVTGAILFLLVRRLAGPGWLGLVPAGVLWLSGDQLFLEHAPLSESLFTALLVATLYAGIRCLEPGWRWPLVTGALAAALLSIRTAGLVVPVMMLVWLAAARWRTSVPLRIGLATAAAATVLVAVAYGTLRDHSVGHWSLTPKGSGWILYARAAEFADCREFKPPAGTAVLCERTPESRRAGPGAYLYHGGPGVRAFGGPTGHDGVVRRFAIAAIEHQPLDFLRFAAEDFVRYAIPSFGPARFDDFSGPESIAFGGDPWLDRPLLQQAGAYYGKFPRKPRAAARGLRTYQRIVRVNGWELLAMFAFGTAGAVLARGRVRWGLILLLAVGLDLLVVPTLTNAEWRYAVPVIGPVAASAAVGAWLAVERLRAGPSSAVAPDSSAVQAR